MARRESSGPLGVVYLINTLDVGGAELGLVRLVDDGFFVNSPSVTVVALSVGGGSLIPIVEATGELVTWQALTDRPLTIARAIALLPVLYRLLRTRNPAVLMMSLPHANVVGRLAGALARVPEIIAVEHSAGLRRRYLHPALRLTSPVVSAVLYDCEATRRFAFRHYFRAANKAWHWIPLFRLSSPVLNRVARKEPPYRVLTVARLEAVKNIEGAIDAIARLRREGIDVEYDIVGSGSLWASLADQIRQADLERTVHLVGFRADWSDLATRADAYLQPSFREGACLAALEAMQYGLPVVGTPVGGLVDYARSGQCVWLATGFSAPELATAVGAVLGQPAVADSLTRSGTSIPEAEYSAAAIRARYREVARSIGV